MLIQVAGTVGQTDLNQFTSVVESNSLEGVDLGEVKGFAVAPRKRLTHIPLISVLDYQL